MTAKAAAEQRVAYLGLGSNVGDRAGYLRAALNALTQHPVRVVRVSSLYETEPMGYLDQAKFLNAVAEVRTSLEPLALLRSLKAIETEIGRTPTFRNGPREIDIDLLAYEDVTLESDELTLPHPRMRQRAFVQVPLQELEGVSGGAQGVRVWQGTDWYSGGVGCVR